MNNQIIDLAQQDRQSVIASVRPRLSLDNTEISRTVTFEDWRPGAPLKRSALLNVIVWEGDRFQTPRVTSVKIN